MNQHVNEPSDAYDVAVIGSGAAGFSAAVALLRFGRSWSSSMTAPHATPPPATFTTCSPATEHHRRSCFSWSHRSPGGGGARPGRDSG